MPEGELPLGADTSESAPARREEWFLPGGLAGTAMGYLRRWRDQPVDVTVDAGSAEVTVTSRETGETLHQGPFAGWSDIGVTTDGGTFLIAPSGTAAPRLTVDDLAQRNGRITWSDPGHDIMDDIRTWWARMMQEGQYGTPRHPTVQTPEAAAELTESAQERPARRSRGRRSQTTAPDAPTTAAPARLGTPGQATADSVVDAITAAVEEKCACGCGMALVPNGPSGYFATQSCQQKWHSAQATNPQEVYHRPDAAEYMGIDGSRWPLTDPDQHQERLRQQEEYERRIFERHLRERTDRFGSRWVPDESSWHRLPTDQREAMCYRRECAGCGGSRQVPRTITTGHPEEIAIRAWEQTGVYQPIVPRVEQVCNACHRPFDGPVLEASVQRLWHGLHFTLRAAGGVDWSVARQVNPAELAGQQDVRAYMDGVWERLERKLERQSRSRIHSERQRISGAQAAQFIREHGEMLRRTLPPVPPPRFPGGTVA